MATATHEQKAKSGEGPDEKQRHREELRRDRNIGVLVLFGFMALIALLIWFARLAVISPTGDF